MIIKKRTKNLNIDVNEALLRRLPSNHPKRAKISKDLAMWKAGLRGELETDYYLQLLPEQSHYIIQGIRLKDRDTIFQIDTLLLSPKYILILEVKNYLGTVTFQPEFEQITRVYNGVEEGFEDPITQAKRHEFHFINWLKEKHIPSIPIDYQVVFGKSTTILKNPSHSAEVYKRVCFAGNLPFKINNKQTQYQKEFHSVKDIKKLGKLLIKNHIPQTPSYSAYQIPQTEIITGIICPSCSAYRMFRIRGCWKCPACGTTSSDAHSPAIADYFLLKKPTISNHQCQEYLHCQNQKLISKLLTSMDLAQQGFRKARVYFPHSFE